jgi:hypothetical protein
VFVPVKILSYSTNYLYGQVPTRTMEQCRVAPGTRGAPLCRLPYSQILGMAKNFAMNKTFKFVSDEEKKVL